MLIVDQLKKDEPQLRLLAMVVLAGLMVLLAGLWWVQVVSTRRYQQKLDVQSLRTVRIPAVRGRILDREGRALAENRPQYNIDLYLEELSTNYQYACSNADTRAHQYLKQLAQAKSRELGRDLTPQERKQFALTRPMLDELNRETRYAVTSNLVADLGARLGQPLELSQKEFEDHYNKSRALPMPLLTNLNAAQIARFEEQALHTPAMDLEVQSIRTYTNGTVAAHLLGYLVHTDKIGADDPSDRYNYRLEDYEGVSGVEKLFDDELRGTAGAKSVLVNNFGYRQGETIWSPAEPGDDVTLTIDSDLQRAADRALDGVREDVHGAIVVMDVRNGDVLAMASSPSYNPNDFIQRPPPDVWAQELERWNDKDLEMQMNHAIQGEYAPGSIFKIVVGMAALEAGLDPKEILSSPGEVPIPGRRPMRDTAQAGDYDFDRALARSCNYYFVTIVTNNLKSGMLQKVVALGNRLHLGERTGIVPRREEYGGYFPQEKDTYSRDWRLGNTANLCIGQDKVAVTPLQVAVLISAVANGGNVFYPRLVSSVTPYGGDQPSQTFPAGRIHDTLGVSQRTLRVVHEAMETDVEGPEGTGRGAAVPGFNIAGKTGTAEVAKNGHNEKSAQITWFGSFGPVENPRYAVVVMIVSGASGGTTCAPLAHEVYLAIQHKEQKSLLKAGALAEFQR
jgi:penicillin-binding protein 2